MVVDAGDYDALIAEMQANGAATTPEFRRKLAATAYARTAAYDAAISGWFAGQLGETFPKRMTFGGIIAFNRALDAVTAEAVADLFAEVIIAPDIDDAAREILGRKKNLRVLTTGAMPDPKTEGMTVRSLAGGYLLQGRDAGLTETLKVVTERSPTEAEMADLTFAFTVAKHVKSNAIVYAKGGATVGVGAGQMSRVNSSRIAAWKAQDAAKVAGDDESWAIGSVVASDAFFPFADGLLAAAEAGATAIIQPGGSVRDDEVIAAANERGLAMVFTGMRHFKH